MSKRKRKTSGGSSGTSRSTDWKRAGFSSKREFDDYFRLLPDMRPGDSILTDADGVSRIVRTADVGPTVGGKEVKIPEDIFQKHRSSDR